MIAILKRPYVLFEAQESKWVAAHNPIIYEFEVSEITEPGYWVKIEVYEFGSEKLLGSLRHSPYLKNGAGKFKVDISGIVRSYLEPEYIFDTDELNQRDSKSTIRCYIKYYQCSFDDFFGFHDDSANQFFALNAVKQFGNPFGSNHAEHVTFADDLTTKARFLTHFNQPRKYVGYPCTLSVIYSENVAGVNIKMIQKEKDINGNEIFSKEGNLDASQIRAVNHLKINDPDDPTAASVQMWLETGEANGDAYVFDGYVDTDYTLGGFEG